MSETVAQDSVDLQHLHNLEETETIGISKDETDAIATSKEDTEEKNTSKVKNETPTESISENIEEIESNNKVNKPEDAESKVIESKSETDSLVGVIENEVTHTTVEVTQCKEAEQNVEHENNEDNEKNDDTAAAEKSKTATTITTKITTEEVPTIAADAITNAKNPTATATATTTTTTTTSNTNDEYAEHITYTDDGNAIYTDPKTKYKYKWCGDKNNWIGIQSSDNANTTTTSSGNTNDNPYENEHYKWCSERNQWIPKAQESLAATNTTTQTTRTQTETEHYKWDATKNAWIPKVQTQQATATVIATGTINNNDVTYGIDEDGQRIYTDKDGAVFFWDASKSAWFPKIDDDFMARYQMNYGFIDNTTASELERKLKDELELKRKAAELQQMAEEARAGTAAAAEGGNVSSAVAGGKRKATQEPPTWFELNPDQNTKVYVSNLPLDITLDEFAELMSKCGMIMRDPQTQKYKLKLYSEADGQIKGDGLCDYIKVESVDLALKILDESQLRGNKIRVQRAKFQMRGEYNPALKPKRKKKDKEKMQKMKEKLFDWRPEKMRGERSKNERTVIIKNLFTPDIFEKEVQLILDYQTDLREECGKCGNVRKVVIYDLHEDGVAQINMSSPEEADLVIQMMHGRYFGQRQLTAEHWDGKTKYKVAETANAVKSRLNNWDQYLETDEDKKAAANDTGAASNDTAAASNETAAASNDTSAASNDTAAASNDTAAASTVITTAEEECAE